MKGRLTREDLALWERLKQSVRPLQPGTPVPGRGEAPRHEASDLPAKAAEARAPAARDPAEQPVRSSARRAPPTIPPAPLAPLETRQRRRLARGITEVDARIDLHGMRQQRAFAALTGFLRRSQLRGDAVVLVITGKGGAAAAHGGAAGEGRGVLRQAVPSWLARPDLRDVVIGFEPAARRHGGEGALYVRLRRRAKAPPAANGS